MPFKTRYGSHYHMTEGCHGATIPCGTEGLTPCSDCCGNAGSSLGGGSALGTPSVTESGGRLAYEELDTFATDGVDITLSAGTLAKVEEDGDLESYLAMVACASTEVYIDDMREVGRNLDGSVTFHVRGEYMGTEDDYREIDDDLDEPPMVGTIQASGAVMEMGSSGLRNGMDTPIGTIDATDLQGGGGLGGAGKTGGGLGGAGSPATSTLDDEYAREDAELEAMMAKVESPDWDFDETDDDAFPFGDGGTYSLYGASDYFPDDDLGAFS